jgi:hypothetical protein
MGAHVRLTPPKPPGRLSRKALTFESEIRRLRLDGHSIEAIRQALSDAGLVVSRSTVKREVARCAKQPSTDARSPITVAAPDQRDPRPTTSNAVPAFANDPRTSKEIAEQFVNGRTTNPLLKARIAHESRRH